MKITGPYKMDQNFIYVFVGDTKYIIAKNGDMIWDYYIIIYDTEEVKKNGNN